MLYLQCRVWCSGVVLGSNVDPYIPRMPRIHHPQMPQMRRVMEQTHLTMQTQRRVRLYHLHKQAPRPGVRTASPRPRCSEQLGQPPVEAAAYPPGICIRRRQPVTSCACAKRALATARTLAREAVQLPWSAWSNVVASPADSRSTGSGQALSGLRRLCCPWAMVHGLCSPGTVQQLCRTHNVQGHCAFMCAANAVNTSLQVGT